MKYVQNRKIEIVKERDFHFAWIEIIIKKLNHGSMKKKKNNNNNFIFNIYQVYFKIIRPSFTRPSLTCSLINYINNSLHSK